MKFTKRKSIKFFIIFMVLLLIFIAIGLTSMYFALPVNRVDITSELIMLGDLNDDNEWNGEDDKVLSGYIASPFNYGNLVSLKVDINKNGFIDDEDVVFLRELYKYSDPYTAGEKFVETNKAYPKAREFFRYIPKTEYIQRPLYLLRNDIIQESPFKDLLEDILITGNNYDNQLLVEIYNETIRFSFAYRDRISSLSEIEKHYIQGKIDYCKNLYEEGDYYNLLLNLISIVEDGETLSLSRQSKFIQQTLYFRDHLRALLNSSLYSEFESGEKNHADVFIEIEKYIKDDFGMDIKIDELEPPRDLAEISNYTERAEWQYYKTSTSEEDFKKLVLYAQYDRRYLRAVSNTTVKNSDLELRNHNLPMILLFREGLRIKNGDKKAVVGMLDESIRIPLGWIKNIPKDKLPSSIAFENFLLPGNKEDGVDKSRHWNVFGGISLYKTPEESFILSLRREVMDLKDEDYSSEAMREFIRDTIANLNGIYYVTSISD